MSDAGDRDEDTPGAPPPDDDGDARLRALVRGAMGKARPAGAAPRADDEPAVDEPAVDEPAVDEPAGDEAPEGGADELLVDEVDLKEALRGALQPPAGSVAPALLRGVQKKLRVRSKGKFYGDGWSTAESPRTTYIVTSAIMLVLIAIVFFVLLPYSSSKLP